MTDVQTVLAALILFQVKHLVFDFFLQTRYQLDNKGTYGHPGGLWHAGGHALGSVPSLILIGPAAVWIAVIAAAEGVIHYHCDWMKERLTHGRGLTPGDKEFWLALGADQAVHQATYVAMTYAAIGLAAS